MFKTRHTSFLRILLPIIVISVSFTLWCMTDKSSLPCVAQADCPEPAANGLQPFPDDLREIFDQASTNRLGNSAPPLPKIFSGYPATNTKMLSGYVPCILLKAIGQAESSGWKQFDADYGESGDTVINQNVDDSCDYGIMQINSIHFVDDPVISPTLVAAEPAYNIGTAARILVRKWNVLEHYVGDNNPHIVEDWYYAVWAYHGGLQADGSLSWGGNPNNPIYPWPREEWDCNPGSGHNQADWPYQEVIWGCTNHPPSSDFWDPVPLTLPSRADLLDVWGGPPPVHIDTPTPYHYSCSVNYLPCVLKNYCTPRYGELLTNGNFNTGDTSGWIASRSNGTESIVQSYAESSYGAHLGQYNSNNDQLYQTICLSTELGSAKLKYYWWMVTNETSASFVWDTLTVNLRAADGSLIQELSQVTNLSEPKGEWQLVSYDLSSYAGQTIRISFEASNDSSLPTHFWIENVSLHVTH